MKKSIILILAILSLSINRGYAQIIIPIIIGEEIMPEHGFLPGRKFPIYETINSFDFNQKHLKVELFDDRDSLRLGYINCSSLEIKNASELSSAQTIFKVKDYIETIFSHSSILIDSSASDKIEIRLQAIDSRLIGFGKIKVHGLCQLKVITNSTEKIYCCDIVDGDNNAPLGSNAFVSRKTASRFMASAAIRECLEHFLVDLNQQLKNCR